MMLHFEFEELCSDDVPAVLVGVDARQLGTSRFAVLRVALIFIDVNRVATVGGDYKFRVTHL